jgi:hypothetical protein
MRAQDMRAVMIRLTPVEHALPQSILKEDGLHMQTFFRQAAKRKIQQRAQALAAMEGDDREDEGATASPRMDAAQNNAPPGLDSR